MGSDKQPLTVKHIIMRFRIYFFTLFAFYSVGCFFSKGYAQKGGGGSATCHVNGPSSVVAGSTATYEIACTSGTPGTITWTVTGGTFTGSGGLITVHWTNNGTTSGNIFESITNGASSGLEVALTYPALIAGTATGSQTIYSGTVPAMLSCGSSSGGTCNGTYSYQWEESLDSIFFDAIPGATALTYTPGALYTKWLYRLKTICGTQTAYSNYITVSIYPPVVPGDITPSDQTINYGTIPSPLSISGTSGGNGGFSYQW